MKVKKVEQIIEKRGLRGSVDSRQFEIIRVINAQGGFVGCCENLRDKINVFHILLKFENIENGWGGGGRAAGITNTTHKNSLSASIILVKFQGSTAERSKF